MEKKKTSTTPNLNRIHSSGKGSTCCPWIWSHGSIKVSSMLKRLLKAATRYGAGGFTSRIRNQRGKSLDLVFGWWIVVGLWFTYSILNYTLGIFFGRVGWDWCVVKLWRVHTESPMEISKWLHLSSWRWLFFSDFGMSGIRSSRPKFKSGGLHSESSRGVRGIGASHSIDFQDSGVL